MRVVIPSRKRAALLQQNALPLFPDAYVCVHESEINDYRAIMPDNRLICHNAVGLPAIRNFVLDWAGNGPVLMCDDDICAMVVNLGTYNKTIVDPNAIMTVVENTAAVADGFGAKLFGWGFSPHPVACKCLAPYQMYRAVSSVYGVFPNVLRYDPKVRARDDVDYCLQHLLRYRVVVSDCRFIFVSREPRMRSIIGGNAYAHSSEAMADEVAYLKAKWGNAVKFSTSNGATSKGRVQFTINVRRMFDDA